MKELILSFVVGVVVGFIFVLLRLPVPAPPVLAGVLGIVGIYSGAVLATRVLQFFQ